MHSGIYNAHSWNDNENNKEDKQENKMVQINGKEYVTVAERLEKLHCEHEKVGIQFMSHQQIKEE